MVAPPTRRRSAAGARRHRERVPGRVPHLGVDVGAARHGAWPPDERPASVVYFCHVHATADPPPADDVGYPAREHATVTRRTRSSSSATTSHHSGRARCSTGTSGWDLLSGDDGRHAPAKRASTRSTSAPTSIRRTATCSRCPAPGATGCGPTRAATTTSRSPATGSTPASTPAASRRRSCRASRPRTRCSAGPLLDGVAGYYQPHQARRRPWRWSAAPLEPYDVRSTMNGTSAAEEAAAPRRGTTGERVVEAVARACASHLGRVRSPRRRCCRSASMSVGDPGARRVRSGSAGGPVEERARRTPGRAGAAVRSEMDQHQGALALADVAEHVLAVRAGRAHEIEHVVLDLERGAEREPELRDRVEVGVHPMSRSARRRAAAGSSCTRTSCAGSCRGSRPA